MLYLQAVDSISIFYPIFDFVWNYLEIFDFDGHILGTISHQHPIITAYLEIVRHCHGSKGLTFSNYHSKANTTKEFA